LDFRYLFVRKTNKFKGLEKGFAGQVLQAVVVERLKR
jgi:hypothetical protein